VEDESITADFSTNGVPRVLVQPRSQFASTGEMILFRVRATSALPMLYQWFLDGNELPGATKPELLLSLSGHGDSGLYLCRISNARGDGFSKPARLVVDGY